MLRITNEDNMELMSRYEDNYFDLAIVDPPYGINGGGDNRKAINTKSRNNLRRLGRAGGLGWDKETPQKNILKNFSECQKTK